MVDIHFDRNKLTLAEERTLILLEQGLGSGAIAEQLGLAIRTISKRKQLIHQKLLATGKEIKFV